jgi:NTE family protein
VVVDVPIRRAAELGARTLYVLGLARLTRPWSEPRRPLQAAIEAYWVARRHRFQRDLESLPADVTVHLLEVDPPPGLRFHDVAYTTHLLHTAHEAATTYLTGVFTPSQAS